jgi:hypothetical protein
MAWLLVGFLNPASPEANADLGRARRKGLEPQIIGASALTPQKPR